MTAVLKRAPGDAVGRQQVLDSARRLFAERGFHAVSLRELGQDVGMHAGSLYAHFENKDALLRELIEDGYERLIDITMLHLTKTPGPRALSMFLRNHLDFQIVNPHWYVLASIESRHLGEEAREEVRSLRTEYATLLEHLLQKRTDGRSSAWKIATVARQALHLLDAPPTGDSAALDDCVDDIEQLILNRLRH
jgi:AcrR family transcriptional regulator